VTAQTSERQTPQITILESKPKDEVIPLLVRESAHPEEKRAIAAVSLAFRLNQQHEIPPEHRIRALLAIERVGGERDSWWHLPFRDVIAREIEFSNAVARAPTATRQSLFRDLANAKRDARENALISVALGRTADAELVEAMHRHLVSNRDPVNAWQILNAFAARTDLPLNEDMKLWPIYRRHLPGLFDTASREVKWEAAVRLARDLPKLDRFEEPDPGCGALPPDDAPVDRLHPGLIMPKEKGLSWPLTDETAASWNERLNSRWQVSNPYAIALLIRWHRTGRTTLPYYPYEVAGIDDGAMRSLPLGRPRGQRQAQYILNPNRFPQDVRWVCAVVGYGPRMDPTRVLASQIGQGFVDATLEVELPESRERRLFFLGPRTQPDASPPESDSPVKFAVSGWLERLDDGGFSIEGNRQARDRSGGGGGSANGYARQGEAMVLDVYAGSGTSSRGHLDAESQPYACTLLWPEVESDWHLKDDWRKGVSRFLSRWSQRPHDPTSGRHSMDRSSWDFDLFRMLQLTAWNHVPEAREPLQKLWNRRAELKTDRFDRDELSHADWVGAALLMSGDDEPLVDVELVNRLPGKLALRIFAFSPNPAIWTALDERAASGVTAPIADEVVSWVAARGDHHSRVYDKARRLLDEHRNNSTMDAIPFLLMALVLVAAGWFPRARGNRSALAASFVLTGLVLRFLTMDAWGRVWIPVAGDLLFLAAAFVHGGWTIRLVAAGLALTGVLQFAGVGATLVVLAGQGLFAAYLAVLSLEQLSQPGMKPRPRGEASAHLVTWLTTIIPVATGVVIGLVSYPSSWQSEPLFHLSGCWMWAYVALVHLSPLAIIYAWRSRAIPPRASLPAEA